MTRLLVRFVCVAFAWAGALPVAAAQAEEAEDRFETILNEVGQSDDIVGLAVAVVRGGEVETIRTFGVRTIDGGEPIDQDTVFRLASLSKGMAASIIGQMVDEERVNLSMPVRAFSETLRLKKVTDLERLTLEDVLSHRTGLPPYAYDNLLEAGVPPAKIRGEYRKVDPICTVGTCYAYQNVTFDTVTELIEAVDGATYEDSAKKRLFAPLGMTRTSVSFDGLRADDNWARPYRRKKDTPWQEVTVKDVYYRVPAAGGVNASITDMAAWLQAQMGYREDVLPKDVLTMIHAPRVETAAELRRLRNDFRGLQDAHYGLGWRIYDYGEHRVISHFGSVDQGYGAQITFIPSLDVGIVILTSSRSRGFIKILPAFLERELNLGG
jgi:beta-lactamase class C